MSDRELVNLIFLPGFSTAEMITKVSGRGVGMDVVKTNIERIGGAIDVQSRPGQGTSIHVKIPLTLAIIPALIVRCRGDRFCIAQAGVVELVRISPERARDAIERVHDAPVYRLREQLLPVVRLGPALGLGDAPDSADHPLNIVVVRADGARFALVVDEVHDSEEIVVKPLGEQLAHLSVYAGATIMGDGRIALILDVPGLAQHAGIVRDEHAPRAAAAPTPAPAPAREFGELLVCSIAAGRRIAIPLTSVARLEELPASAIERTGGHEVVQHRGRVIPLVRLSAVLGGCAVQDPAATDRVHTVICSGATGDAALAVDAVLEIVRDAATVAGGPTAPGIAGCALIHGRVTDLVDVRALIRRASGGEHGRPTAA